MRIARPCACALLGEDLVAFRDSNNKIGVVEAHCPHRGASLYFGRNEECGIRCVYHGWKFGVDGLELHLIDANAYDAISELRVLVFAKNERRNPEDANRAHGLRP